MNSVDERLNVIALLAALLLTPILVGVLVQSVAAVLIAYVLTQTFVIGCIVLLASKGAES